MKELHRNIIKLSQSAPSRLKSKVLYIVAPQYKKKEQTELGYEFSNDQYKRALDNNNYQDMWNKRKRTKIDTEINKVIVDELNKSSNYSTKTDGKGNSIRYLRQTKISIYNKIKETYPRIKLSRTKFYKSCPSHFKKPQKKTDICPICLEGQRLEKKIRSIKDMNLKQIY